MGEEKTTFEQLYNIDELRIPATNTWITPNVLNSSLMPSKKRGSENKTFYNLFVRISGVDDKSTYKSFLYNWKTIWKNLIRQCIF